MLSTNEGSLGRLKSEVKRSSGDLWVLMTLLRVLLPSCLANIKLIGRNRECDILRVSLSVREEVVIHPGHPGQLRTSPYGSSLGREKSLPEKALYGIPNHSRTKTFVGCQLRFRLGSVRVTGRCPVPVTFSGRSIHSSVVLSLSGATSVYFCT